VMLALAGCSGVASSHPSPTPTPAPSFSVTPAPTVGTAAARADELYGTFDSVSAAGDGEDVIPLPPEVTRAHSGIVRMTYDGTEPLVLWSLDVAGEKQMILIDATIPLIAADPASFDGETTWWKANDPPHALQVEGDGSWELTVSPVSSAPPLEGEGRGTRVYLYDGAGGSFAGHKSDTEVGMSVTEFVLDTGGGSPKEAVVDKRADADFVVALTRGPSMVIVTHRGDWSIDIPIEER